MGQSMGGFVAGINNDQTKYFSCTVEMEAGQSVSSLLGPKVVMALHAYRSANSGNLPSRIIFYRDGVGEGQLKTVNDTEVAAVKVNYLAVNPNLLLSHNGQSQCNCKNYLHLIFRNPLVRFIQRLKRTSLNLDLSL